MWLSTIGFLVTCGISLLGTPLVADAQQQGNVPRIGMLGFGYPPSEAGLQPSRFLQELRTLGWVEGQNLVIERRSAAFSGKKLPDLVAELLRLKVDVIVALGGRAARAAKKATTTVPIVIAVGDALEQGLVTNLARPGGNITGFTNINPDLSGKRLELLKEAVPWMARVAVLWCPDLAGNPPQWSATQVAAQGLGVQLQSLEVRSAGDIEAALAAATPDRADAIVVFDCAYFPMRVAARVTKLLLPAMYPYRGFVEAGGLMSYGPNNAELAHQVAVYVDKILKGAKPGDLPVQQPTKFELVINLKPAKTLGLTLPPTLLFQADEMIR
jgi:putative ABC transport system substrate-binding protein